MKKIYIVDDERSILRALTIWFQRKNYLVDTFLNSVDFLKSLIQEKPSLIILDIDLQGDDGRQVCSLIKVKYDGRLPVILISATPELGTSFCKSETDAFFEKPFGINRLK